MSSPKVYLEEQLALREQLARQLAFMEKGFEARSGGEDMTEESIARVRLEVAELDARIERLRTGSV